ncbi:MAG: DNA mismatch repair endonuclease MutL [Candidatus Sigynarchaeota archaeon]
MGNIHKIKDFEKIAAGEVIERPAAVVKELLENAIDAGATRIEINIEEAGTKSIKVIDDGCGIEPEEVILAFDRHTTSKINEFNDVYNLSTLGFRGEALASIKAVARVEIVTRTKKHDLGKKVVLEGDQLLEDSSVACPIGTTITVKKLFFNVPVRRKFLKNEAVEFSHISDIVTRYALAYHDVAIKLFHDGHLVLDAPPSKGELLNKIVSIYGHEQASRMIAIDQKAPDFSLHGFIAAPDITRSARSYSTLLVNRRYVASADIARAIENAYETRLMKGRYPFYVLFLDIKPSLIDVNIHPTKKEIKFSNENELLERIETWVRAALDAKVNQAVSIPAAGKLDDHVPGPRGVMLTSGKQGTSTGARENRASRKKSFDDILEDASERIPERILDLDDDFSQQLDDGQAKADVETGDGNGVNGETPSPHLSGCGEGAILSGWKPLDVKLAEGGLEHVDSGTFKVLPPLRLLSNGVQLGNTFLFFASADGGLVIVDQHAASERIEYERIVKKYKASGIKSQQMLVPKVLSLPPSLLPLIDANQTALKRLGFEIVKDHAGDVPSYKVVQFPIVFHVNVSFQVIEDFLTSLLSMDKLDEEDDIFKLLACHAAIRAGEPMDRRQIWTLLSDLDKCEDPYHCCHGRPTFIVKPTTWLDKEFKRTV